MRRTDRRTSRSTGGRWRCPVNVASLRAHSVSFVHQNLGLMPSLTVLENLLLPDFAAGARLFVDWRAEAKRARELFARYDIGPRSDATAVMNCRRWRARNSPSSERSTNCDGDKGKRARVARARRADAVPARARCRGVVSAGARDRRRWRERHLRFARHRRGPGDHRPRDRAAGRARSPACFETANSLESRRHPPHRRPKRRSRCVAPRAEDAGGAFHRRIGDLAGGVLAPFSLTLSPGEVVGLTGLIGSGYDEVIYRLYGAAPRVFGNARDRWCGRSSLDDLDPRGAIARGCVLIPGDRLQSGAVATLSLSENINQPVLGEVTRP